MRVTRNLWHFTT